MTAAPNIPLNEHRQLALKAASCAEQALPLFESAVHDDRPRRAIAAARAWAEGKITCGQARKAAFSAHAAAREVTDYPAALAAARAAAHAAATAHVPGHALHAEAYARKALENAPDAV